MYVVTCHHWRDLAIMLSPFWSPLSPNLLASSRIRIQSVVCLLLCCLLAADTVAVSQSGDLSFEGCIWWLIWSWTAVPFRQLLQIQPSLPGVWRLHRPYPSRPRVSQDSLHVGELIFNMVTQDREAVNHGDKRFQLALRLIPNGKGETISLAPTWPLHLRRMHSSRQSTGVLRRVHVSKSWVYQNWLIRGGHACKSARFAVLLVMNQIELASCTSESQKFWTMTDVKFRQCWTFKATETWGKRRRSLLFSIVQVNGCFSTNGAAALSAEGEFLWCIWFSGLMMITKVLLRRKMCCNTARMTLRGVQEPTFGH